MNGMAARGEFLAQLGAHNAAAAVGWINCNADIHDVGLWSLSLALVLKLSFKWNHAVADSRQSGPAKKESTKNQTNHMFELSIFKDQRSKTKDLLCAEKAGDPRNRLPLSQLVSPSFDRGGK